MKALNDLLSVKICQAIARRYSSITGLSLEYLCLQDCVRLYSNTVSLRILVLTCFSTYLL